MPNIRLVRPDGSLLDVPADQAGKFQVLGYRPQTPEEYQAQESATGLDNYWSSGKQKVFTAIEGVTSGLTLGLSDKALDLAGAEDFKQRGMYNPGTRMGAEIVGSLLPVIPGASALKAVTPAGMLIRGAESVGASVAARGAGKAIQRGVTGAIEGAGFGAGAALSHATLSGDPLTAEAISAGLGFGALLGGSLGALGGKTEAVIEGRAARRAAAEAQEVATRDAWAGFRSSVDDLSSVVDDSLKASVDVPANINNALKGARGVNKTLSEMAPLSEPGAFKLQQHLAKQAAKAFEEVQLAAKEGNALRMEVALDAFKQHSEDIAGLTGMIMPELSPFSAQGAKWGLSATKDIAALNAAAPYLKAFPASLDEFSRMTPARADKLIGAIDQAMSLKSPEFAAMREGITNNINRLSESMGVVIDGAPSTQLRGLYEAAKEAVKVPVERGGKLPWLMGATERGASYAAGGVLSRMAGERGGGTIARTIAYEGGRKLIAGLLNLRNAVIGSVGKVASDWAPKAVAKAAPYMSRTSALAISIDGYEDKGKATAEELMRRRSEELRNMAGGVRDSLYANIQGLAVEHPELAAEIHAQSVARFEFLMSKLPKDPGNAFNRMKTLWKPSKVEIEQFARFYEVFQNPIAVVRHILKTGKVLPEQAEGLREMYPSLWTDLRVNMLNRLGDPAVRNKLSYSEQVSLGTLLNLPIHSTMTAKFIAPQQEMFLIRNQPLGIPPKPGVNGGGGRPPGPSSTPGSTSAQRITEH